MKKKPNCDHTNYKNFHFCEVNSPYHLRGEAIVDCYQDIDGCLFVCNGEYGSQVNFCPMCGYEAKSKIET